MKITPDTNLLVRALVRDDAAQAALAERELAGAEAVVFTNEALCELVWVLSRRYRRSNTDIAAGIRTLVQADTAIFDQDAVEAGLAMLDAGGDFADGVIAHLGRAAGGRVFVSFDRKAVRLLEQSGQPARLLA